MTEISVIMGVYNITGLAAFHCAIQSILGQSFSDYEFIICDDGSTDATWPILLSYQQQDDRVRLLRNETNQGLAAALNRCLATATGRYVARQDADDISRSDRFAVQAAFLGGNPSVDFVGSNVTLYDEHGIWGQRCLPPFPSKRDFLFSSPFIHGALMVRRDAYQLAGGYRVARVTRRAEDYDLLMRMYARGLRGANIQQPLYSFREDGNSEKRRKYRYRIDETAVRFRGFSAMGLLPQAFPYVVKPLAVGLIPANLLRRLKFKKNIYSPYEERKGEKQHEGFHSTD